MICRMVSWHAVLGLFCDGEMSLARIKKIQALRWGVCCPFLSYSCQQNPGLLANRICLERPARYAPFQWVNRYCCVSIACRVAQLNIGICPSTLFPLSNTLRPLFFFARTSFTTTKSTETRCFAYHLWAVHFYLPLLCC